MIEATVEILTSKRANLLFITNEALAQKEFYFLRQGGEWLTGEGTSVDVAQARLYTAIEAKLLVSNSRELHEPDSTPVLAVTNAQVLAAIYDLRAQIGRILDRSY